MRFLDKIHKGVVVVCIGLTLYGTGLIGHRVYRYFTVIRPQRESAELKMLEVKSNFESYSTRLSQMIYLLGITARCSRHGR